MFLYYEVATVYSIKLTNTFFPDAVKVLVKQAGMKLQENVRETTLGLVSSLSLNLMTCILLKLI